jgi:hypothetical protein
MTEPAPAPDVTMPAPAAPFSMSLRVGIVDGVGGGPARFAGGLSTTLAQVRVSFERALNDANAHLGAARVPMKLEREALVVVVADREAWGEVAGAVGAEVREASPSRLLGGARDVTAPPPAEQLIVEQSDLVIVLRDESDSVASVRATASASEAQVHVVPILPDGVTPSEPELAPKPDDLMTEVQRLVFPLERGQPLIELGDFLREASATWLDRGLASIFALLWRIFVSKSASLEGGPSAAPRGRYEELVARTSRLADRYQAMYRGAFVCNYVMGAGAVTLALFEYVFSAHEPFTRGLAVAECLAIAIIMFVYRRGRERRWHERAVAYRALSEHLRMMPFLETLGLTVPSTRPPAHAPASAELATSWVIWYFRCIVRAAPPASVTTQPKTAMLQAADLDVRWLRPQAAYHEANARRMESAELRCARPAVVLFVFALAFGLLNLANKWLPLGLPHGLEPWFVFVAAGLPAWGGALHAIEVQGEFHLLAERSKAMTKRLENYAKEVEPKVDEATVNVTHLRDVARRAAGDMVTEVHDWHTVYMTHSIPAA